MWKTNGSTNHQRVEQKNVDKKFQFNVQGEEKDISVVKGRRNLSKEKHEEQ